MKDHETIDELLSELIAQGEYLSDSEPELTEEESELN